MPKKCVLLGTKLQMVSPVLEQAGYQVDSIDRDLLDDRDYLAILDEAPFAIILPLTLGRYGSLRIAELIALTQQPIRLLLVSGTAAPRETTEQLFDIHLPSLGDGMSAALDQNEWVHAFERRTGTIDSAIQQVLKDASCFLANSHSFSWQTLVDYQRAISDARREFTILFVASDPVDQARLALLREYSEVQNELSRRSDFSFTLKQEFSSRPDDLARVLLDAKPHIMHFSGHGDSTGRLCFEDAVGRSFPADNGAIAQMFEPVRRHVKCVILNACYSAEQAEMIGAHVEYTAGLNPEVSDDAAIALARGFYGSLSVTGKVSQALQTAKANLKLLSGDNTELHVHDRVLEFRGNAP